jgi:UDP-glucose 4-epimerase
MKIAVTGGAGYIGSTLVKNLLDQHIEVVSIDDLSRGSYNHLKNIGADEKARLIQGDIRDTEVLEKEFRGSDAIAHLAAIPGLVLCRERPKEAISVNIYGTHQVLEAARKLDIEKVVFCSSAAVYGKPNTIPVKEEHPLRPLNLYGVTKLAGEKLMEVYHENHGMETISLRFGNVYGVGLYTNYDTVVPKFIKQAMTGQALTVFGDGKSTRDFVHVEDIVQAITLALDVKGLGGEAYNVGGETISIGELAALISKTVQRTTRKNPEVIHLPPRTGETKEFSYNLEKIKTQLRYKPSWSIDRGVNQIIENTLNTDIIHASKTDG